MKSRNLTNVLLAATQTLASPFLGAQTPPPTALPGMPPPFVKPNVGDVLTRVLSLTDAQKAQLQPYIDTVQPQLDAIHQQAHQSADALLRQLTVSIRPLLSSEQQTKLDVLEKLRTGAAPVNPVGVGSIFANGPAQVAQ